MTYEAVDVYVNDTTPLKKPVSGVTVKVTSQDGTIFFSQTETDAQGHAGFMLPSGATYQMRLYKFQVGFTNPQYFTVLSAPVPPQTNMFNVSAQLLTPPVPLDSRLCTAFGFFRDIAGAPAPYTDVHFIAKFDPLWVDGDAILRTPLIVRSDEHGYMQVNLFRHGHYDCTVVGEEDITRHIKVPDAPNVNLPDLLFPIVAALVLDPPGPNYTIHVNEELPLNFRFFASDGEDLHSAFGDVLWRLGNQDVASYSIARDCSLTLRGVGPGTTFLCATRANKSIVHIPEVGILNGILNITVLP